MLLFYVILCQFNPAVLLISYAQSDQGPCAPPCSPSDHLTAHFPVSPCCVAGTLSFQLFLSHPEFRFFVVTKYHRFGLFSLHDSLINWQFLTNGFGKYLYWISRLSQTIYFDYICIQYTINVDGQRLGLKINTRKTKWPCKYQNIRKWREHWADDSI